MRTNPVGCASLATFCLPRRSSRLRPALTRSCVSLIVSSRRRPGPRPITTDGLTIAFVPGFVPAHCCQLASGMAATE